MIQRQTSDKPHETTASECNDEYAWIQQTEKCKCLTWLTLVWSISWKKNPNQETNNEIKVKLEVIQTR